jgi:hypothetical protein
MNKISLLITFFFLLNCSGQDKKDINSKIMTTESFDIIKFDKDRSTVFEGETINSNSVTDTIKEGVRTRTIFDEGYIEIINPTNSLFGSYKEYYKNGSIKNVRTKNLVDYVEGYAPWGKEYQYDISGKLTKEINYECLYQNVKVNPEILFVILNKENIFEKNNPAKYRLSIWFHDEKVKPEEKIWNRLKYNNGDNPFWEIVRDYRQKDEEPIIEKVFKIDAKSGNIQEVKGS